MGWKSVCVCTRASYMNLSLSTFVAAYFLPGPWFICCSLADPQEVFCFYTCVCACFTVRCVHAARPAICSLSVLHKASLSKQARAGEMLVLMGYSWQPNPFFFPLEEHTFSLPLSPFAWVVQHIPRFSSCLSPFLYSSSPFFSPVSATSDGRTQSHNAILLSPAAHFDKAVSLSPSDRCSIVQWVCGCECVILHHCMCVLLQIYFTVLK